MKKCYIGVYVTPEEKNFLNSAAKEAQISVSELIKRSVFVPASEQTPPTETMTVLQMAEYLHVSKRKARSLCEEGTIPSFRIGKQYRVEKAALDEYIEKERRQATELPDLLRPEEAASYLKVSRTTVHRMIVSGEIKACRVSGRHRISRENILNLIGDLSL